MRLFVGIPLADAVTNELAALVSRLRSGAANLRWTPPGSWHITLQFLGNVTQEQLQCLGAGLGEIRSAPVPIQIGELGFFDRAGVFFADVVVSPALMSLQERVVAATAHCGFAAETRPYHPHITLAKKTGKKGQSDQGNELRELVARGGRQPAFTRFTAHEFLLYESHLSSAGSKYEIRARFPLRSEPSLA
jgi:RNA 2',3'-cyclic 3'-phosphodiesterase